MNFDRKFPGEPFPYISPEKEKEIFKTIKKDSALPAHIQATGKAKKPSEFRQILCTGVTGHLGPYLLQQLSLRDSLTHIFCLVRAHSAQEAQTRVVNRLKMTGLLENTNVKKIYYVLGDVAEKNLGLDANTYDTLSNIVDAVVHNAVCSNHLKIYPNVIQQNNEGEEDSSKKCPLKDVNVGGVINILEFATKGVTKHVLHGSSFSCVNRRDPFDGGLLEELPEDDNLGDGIRMGYAYTKFVGEKLMKTALEQRGIPVTVARYPIICGDSKTGYTAELDNFTVMTLSFWSCGLVPDNNFGMCLCPVDTCALLAIKLLFVNEAPLGVYNINLPTPANINYVYDVGRKAGILSIRKCRYEEYFEAVVNHDDPSNRLLTSFKKIYSKGHGLKEFSHTCPALRLSWHDPEKFSGNNRKLNKFIPGHEKLLPSPYQCVHNMLHFFMSSEYASELGIHISKSTNKSANPRSPPQIISSL